MALFPLCCLSSDCPTVIVQRKRWKWLESDGEQQVATWLHHLVFDPKNKIMAQTQPVGFQAAFQQTCWCRTLTEADSDINQRQVVQRGIVKVHFDLLSHIWWLIAQLGFSRKNTQISTEAQLEFMEAVSWKHFSNFKHNSECQVLVSITQIDRQQRASFVKHPF